MVAVVEKTVPAWLSKLLEELRFDEPMYLGDNLWGRVYTITPVVAEKMLERNTKNRNKKLFTIVKYAADMTEGRWVLTHQAVAFDIKGVLSDGQNRLQAVVDSHKTVNMLVVFGVPQSSRISIDTGAPRSALDGAHFANVADASTLMLGTAKNLHNGYNFLSRPISNSHVLELLKTYEAGLDFVWKNLGIVKGVTTSAAVRAAIARAYYEFGGDAEARERLQRFCEVLTDGQFNQVKKDRIAAQLRDKLLHEKYYGRKRLAYGLTEKAISFFMNDEVKTRLIAADFEMYPFEGEEDEVEATEVAK